MMLHKINETKVLFSATGDDGTRKRGIRQPDDFQHVAGWMKGLALEVGCATNRISPTIMTVDRQKTPHTDLVWDIEKKQLPFQDKTFDTVFSCHCIKDLSRRPKPGNIHACEAIRDFIRITKPGGYIVLMLPSMKDLPLDHWTKWAQSYWDETLITWTRMGFHHIVTHVETKKIENSCSFYSVWQRSETEVDRYQWGLTAEGRCLVLSVGKETCQVSYMDGSKKEISLREIELVGEAREMDRFAAAIGAPLRYGFDKDYKMAKEDGTFDRVGDLIDEAIKRVRGEK